MKILNLTQHKATQEQIDAGVVEPIPEIKNQIIELITFNERNFSRYDLLQRGIKLAEIARLYDAAMVGGAPFFGAILETELLEQNVLPVYAFSKRVVVEKENGVKESVFKFEGFVSLYGELD